MALGASPTADAFADEDDQPDGGFNANWESTEFSGTQDFRDTVLNNLDMDRAELNNLFEMANGETTEHNEHQGDYTHKLVFRMDNGKLLCDFDGQETVICQR